MLTFNFTPFPNLSTARLTLRQLVPSDAPALFVLRSDPRVIQFIPRPLAQSVDDTAAYIGQINDRMAANELINWGITRTDNSQVIGTIGLYSLRPKHFRAEIGYLLHPEQQGQGLR